jgi:hypothetical protein
LGDGTTTARDIPPSLPSTPDAPAINTTTSGPLQQALARPYDTALWQVHMNAGESLHLALESSRATNQNMVMYGPDARALFSFPMLFGSDPTQHQDVWNVKQSGRYVLQVVPDSYATASYSMTASFGVTASASVNGGAVRVSILRPAQDARVGFVGQPGQNVNVTVQGPSRSATWVVVYGPDGNALKQARAMGDGVTTVKLGALPASGAYGVRLNPDSFAANAPEATDNASLGTYTVSVVTAAASAATAFEAQLAPSRSSTIYLPITGKQFVHQPLPPQSPGPTAWQTLMTTLQAQSSNTAARAEVTKYC